MVLGNMGEDAAIALPQIITVLDDEDKHVRRSAASAVTRVPATTSATQLELVKALETDDRYLRSQASMAAFNVLEKQSAEDEDYVKKSAAKALADIEANTRTVTPAIN